MDKATIDIIVKFIDTVLKFIQVYCDGKLVRSKNLDKVFSVTIVLLLFLLIICGLGGSALICIQISLFNYMQFLGLSAMVIWLILSFGNLLLTIGAIWLFFKIKRSLLSSIPFN